MFRHILKAAALCLLLLPNAMTAQTNTQKQADYCDSEIWLKKLPFEPKGSFLISAHQPYTHALGR